MSGFFDSDMVRKSIQELDDIQKELFVEIFDVPFFTKERKKEHLNKMKLFLEKQKILVFRLFLSNDPEAMRIKNKILDSYQALGIKKTNNLNEFFDKIEESLERLEKTLDV